MRSTVGTTFEDLPNEIIAKILMYCDEDDRKFYSLLNKRFLNVCRSLPIKVQFHLQGNTPKLFKYGLDSLTATKIKKYKTVKISKFNLIEVFDEKIREGKLFERPFVEYVKLSIEELELYECIVTDDSLTYFRYLFPNLKNLTLTRCFFFRRRKLEGMGTLWCIDQARVSDELKLERPKPLIGMFLTVPVFSDQSSTDTFTWLISHCGSDTEFCIKDSPVSHKRSVARRFAKVLASVSSKELIEKLTLDPAVLFDLLPQWLTN